MPARVRSWTFWCAVVAVAGACTLPRLPLGYGVDGDAVRGVVAALSFVETGSFIPSRLPGNPLYELGLAAIVPWAGAIGSNLWSLASHALAAAALFSLLHGHRFRHEIAALFALTPALLLQAANTLDFVPGLALLLASYACACRGRDRLAVLCLGLAIGMRLTNLLFLLPFALHALLRGQALRSVALRLAAALSLGLVFYLPAALALGHGVFRVPGPEMRWFPYLLATGYRAVALLGPLATLALLGLLGWSAAKFSRVLGEGFSQRDPRLAAELSALLLYPLPFLWQSDETAYLLPVLPFVYLLLARVLGAGQWIALGLAVFSFGFGTVELVSGESGRRKLGLEPAAGILVADFQRRRELEALRSGIGALAGLGPAVVVTGMGPQLFFANEQLVAASASDLAPGLDPEGISGLDEIHRVEGSEVFLVHGLSLENVERLQRRGTALFMFDVGAPSAAIHNRGYDPWSVGFERIVLWGEEGLAKLTARGSRPAARSDVRE